MTTTTDHFLRHLPHRPYCSDDLAHGVMIRQRRIAVGKAYIQPNPPALQSWMVFDCDHDRTFGVWDDARLPSPNLAVLNRDNGRGHLFYRLDTVCRSNAARLAPLRYLASIEEAFTTRLGADPGYAGLIAKNPLSARWLVHDLHAKAHTLGELADWVDLRGFAKTPGARAVEMVSGLGRNCTLFDRLRAWAYSRVDQYRQLGGAGRSFDMFANACLSEAGGFNTFPTPLALSEIRAVAKSVAKWTWRHYHGGGVNRGRDANGITRHHGFNATSGLYLPLVPKLAPEVVAERRQKAAVTTASTIQKTNASKILAAESVLKAQGKPLSVRAVALAAGVGISTVQRHRAAQKAALAMASMPLPVVER